MTALAPVQTIAIRLACTPPSYASVDWWSQRRACSPWRGQIAHFLAAGGSAVQADHVNTRIVATFADRRERNPERFEPVIARATWEALADLGYIEARDQVVVDFELVRGKSPSTLIELFVTGKIG